LVALVIRHFLRAANRQINKFRRTVVGFRMQPVKRALSLTPRLHQLGILQQPQMRRDARLAHPRDLLKFIDRKLILLQQCHNAQPGGVR
jgi:hypothetical protein